MTSASGTSAQNTLPHAKCWSSSPPSTGPAATPMPTTAPHTPSAAARSRRSRKVLVMIDSVVGKISAAKVPIAILAAIRAPASVTRAPVALAAANPTRPTISAGRRPKRSERLPMASTSAAKARL